jgi:hypothetical protein
MMSFCCGCGRLSLNFPRYFSNSKHLTHAFRKPTLHIVARRCYRGKRAGVAWISSISDADSFVSSLSPKERSLVQEAMKERQDDGKSELT